MSKKIGLVACYFKHNYGSQLQAYATHKYLNDNGIENEVINIDECVDFKNGKRKYYKSQIFNFSFIKSKLGMIKLRIDKKINKKLSKNIKIRDEKYNEFIKKNYNLSKPFKTYKEMNEWCSNYTDVIVGSDQLWLPVNVVADYYTLNWVPETINKISYSTSFGVKVIPERYKELYKKFLSRINFISTREFAGQEIIKELANREAEVVCDPTLLFNKEEWMCIQENEPIIKEKYILCYFLGNNLEYMKFAERLKKYTGYKIVSLNHADEYVKYADKFADETPYDVGPAEFLNLLRNAEYVCTDSFHGTVFSLIYNKMFYSFRRYSKKTKNSTNSRLDSLLGIVDLKERFLNGTEKIEDVVNLKIDYKKVDETLENFRNKSKEFLENALKN